MMGFNPSSWRIDDTVHPFATGLRLRGRADHHAVGGDVLRLRAVRSDARMRPRALRGGHRRFAAAHAARAWRFARAARVPESACGRTWSAAAVRSAGCSRRGSARCSTSRPRRSIPTCCTALSTGPALVHPGRGRRGDLRPAHRAALRARAGADRGAAGGDELPEAWNARFKEYFGLEVPDDAQGVLQDVHWSAGLIGYFPTYALGNLIAGQLWERAHVGPPRPRRADRGRRARPAARMAARTRPPPRRKVLHQLSCCSASSADRSPSGRSSVI